VPLLGDIPVLGRLFRFDSDTEQRTELLIIMTPHIVNNEEDAERVKRAEIARMHWCLADVIEIHSDSGLRGRSDEWSDSETTTIYPDLTPSAETIPTPKPEPVQGQNASPKQPTPASKPPTPDQGAKGAFGGARSVQPPNAGEARPIYTPGGTVTPDSSAGPVLEPQPAAGAALYQQVPQENAAEHVGLAEYDLRPTAHTTVRYGPPPVRWARQATYPLTAQ